MKHCDQDMRDWSYHRNNILEEKVSHFYCKKCGSHFFDGTWYTADEWFFYINEMNWEQNHMHELINH